MNIHTAATSIVLADADLPAGVADLLVQQKNARPNEPAVFFKDQVITYGALADRARGIAIALFEAGITRGDKVGILFPNHPDFIASFFAVARIGATVVPINPFLKCDEIEHILFDSEAKAIIVHEQLLSESSKALLRLESCKHAFVFSYNSESPEIAQAVSDLKNSRAVIKLDDQELRSRCASPSFLAGQVSEHGVLISKDELAVLVYTSGTTGKPKGAMLTHGNLIAAVNMKRRRIHFRADDRILAVLPLCHIYGLGVVMLGMISQGGAMVVLEKFDAQAALSAIERQRVTIVPGVPSMYQFMANELSERKYDLSSLRFGLCGAAPIDAGLLKRLDELFGVPILEGYALTETTCIGTITPPQGPRKFGSVGPKVPGIELAVVDRQLKPMQPGAQHVGEIAIKGPNVMQGYYKQPSATADSLRDGWFLTGDLGYLDEDQYLYICGRSKEMIIRGGQNIYPREVEAVISKMEEVLDCAVVGVPDKNMGERVKAVIVLRDGVSLSEDDVKEYCSQRLASFKVPRIVEFREVMPRNSTGKILKRLLV